MTLCKADAMTGAELKTILQGLGLPPSWFAGHMGVTMRTVVRWFDSETIPLSAEHAVDKLQANALAEVEGIMAAANAIDGAVTIYTYRTDEEWQHRGMPSMTVPCVASWHRAITYRAFKQLTQVTIEFR